MSIENLRDTIVPKSDQLNADDLIAAPMTVKITAVKRSNDEQPISIELAGQRPYKPCKSMRRVLITAWGDDGRAWVGQSMTLYNDPEVKWAGVKVGGIRISHLSGINTDLEIALTATKGKRAQFSVKKLTEKMYSAADFEKNLPAMIKAIDDGKHTVESMIDAVQKKSGKLTQGMIDRIKPTPKIEEPTTPTENEEDF